MNDNLPLGASNDPRAPWNDNGYENVHENVVVSAIDMADDDLVDALWDRVEELVKNWYVDEALGGVPSQWEDLICEDKDSIVEEVYDDIKNRLTIKLK